MNPTPLTLEELLNAVNRGDYTSKLPYPRGDAKDPTIKAARLAHVNDQRVRGGELRRDALGSAWDPI